MVKLTNTIRSTCAATIAAGVLAGFVVRGDESLVQEPTNEKTGPPPASWIGKQVITKDRAPSGSASEPSRSRSSASTLWKRSLAIRPSCSCSKTLAPGSN